MHRRKKFDKMYSQYATDIFRFLYVHVREVELAEDLTAETFTKAWQKIDTFDFKQPKAWLYTIARNKLTDHWRSKRTLSLDEKIEIVDERELIPTVIDKKMANEKLMVGLSKLPEEMRSVVSLRFLQGYSAKQAGESLGLSEANVRIIQFRALKKLKDLLK